MHPRPKGIKNPRHANIHLALIPVRIHHRLRHTFALVVTTPRPNRIHVPPVGFRLRMHLRISIHLRRGGKKHPRPDTFRQTEHIKRPHRRGLDRLNGVVLIMRGRGGTGQVVDLVHLLHDAFRHVVYDETEIGMVEPVFDVLLLSGEEVVEDGDFVALHHELVDEVTSDESGAAGDHDFESFAVDESLGFHGDGGCDGGYGLEAVDVVGVDDSSCGDGWTVGKGR
mmetsp:Transcript_33807/g.40500  ORF Transcript_33807/g.40500 Transcript_33807/m.40500 type:complete len:225 (-) Transcript_33807:210-884(-)